MRTKRILTKTLKNKNLIASLLKERCVVNHAVPETKRDKELAIEIFSRQNVKRHDINILIVSDFDKTIEVILLVRRDELEEEKYFLILPPETFLLEDVLIEEVLKDQQYTYNYGKTRCYECLLEIIEIFQRQRNAFNSGCVVYLKQNDVFYVLHLTEIPEHLLGIK